MSKPVQMTLRLSPELWSLMQQVMGKTTYKSVNEFIRCLTYKMALSNQYQPRKCCYLARFIYNVSVDFPASKQRLRT